jgi:hypothetical protein
MGLREVADPAPLVSREALQMFRLRPDARPVMRQPSFLRLSNEILLRVWWMRLSASPAPTGHPPAHAAATQAPRAHRLPSAVDPSPGDGEAGASLNPLVGRNDPQRLISQHAQKPAKR